MPAKTAAAVIDHAEDAKPYYEAATNLRLWSALETTDPKYVKAITGRQYKGSSPNPTYIAKRLTEALGPMGHDWGTTIIEEGYREFGTIEDKDYALLHRIRLRLWIGDPSRGIEHLGETKVAYRANSGKLIVDDDGAKKSVTDAFVKCASLLGASSDIFLGRWDDNKYQAELADKFGSAEAPSTPAPPPSNGRGSVTAPAGATTSNNEDF